MIHAAIDVPVARRSAETLITEAMRCWQRARVTGVGALPQLYALLARSGRPMLAPVLDSVMRLFENRLGRPIAIGQGRRSADELLLLDLLKRDFAIGTPFGSAICSTRAMLWEGL